MFFALDAPSLCISFFWSVFFVFAADVFFLPASSWRRRRRQNANETIGRTNLFKREGHGEVGKGSERPSGLVLSCALVNQAVSLSPRRSRAPLSLSLILSVALSPMLAPCVAPKIKPNHAKPARAGDSRGGFGNGWRAGKGGAGQRTTSRSAAKRTNLQTKRKKKSRPRKELRRKEVKKKRRRQGFGTRGGGIGYGRRGSSCGAIK
jgi:hypothetical protein